MRYFAAAICFLIFISIQTRSSLAVFLDGNNLYAACESYERVRLNHAIGDDVMNSGICMGYIYGAIDVIYSLDKDSICLPSNANRGQITDIAINFMISNPSLRSYSAASLIKGALESSFPCNRSN